MRAASRRSASAEREQEPEQRHDDCAEDRGCEPRPAELPERPSGRDVAGAPGIRGALGHTRTCPVGAVANPPAGDGPRARRADSARMARQLWPLFALPVALAALAASLALQPAARATPSSAPSAPAPVAPDARPAVSPRLQRTDPRPAPPRAVPAQLVARVAAGRSVTVRTRPRGPVFRVLGSRTEFGSPRALGVVRRRGRWIGVTIPELGDGRLGWVDARSTGVRLAATAVSLVVDLSSRRLELRGGNRVLRAVSVSVGAPGSQTPTGRYAVTDKLPGARFSSVYGCCILALSGRQPNLPAGWTGGDRLAIHGGPAPIGRAVSAGCLHASERDLRALVRAVPLGAPVVIRA